MQTIYKYQITNLDGVTLRVPYCADLTFDKQVLHCEVQNDVPCIWALVDNEREQRPIRVVVYGTGHDVSEAIARGLKHVGSFMLLGGGFVGHVFTERGNPYER
jgi:hypothetical protein